MKYVFGILAVLLVGLMAVLLVFGGGNDQAVSQTKPPTLLDHATTSVVQYTTYGKLVGENQRRAIRISVSPLERKVEVLAGYDESVVATQTYANTQAAYDNFLVALEGQGYTKSRSSSITDPRGVCTEGKRFEYRVVNNGTDITKLWSNSCDKLGTFAGSPTKVQTLFQAQIPEYNTVVKDVRL